ncbi:neurotransmitter:Na+ symporter, NSS family [Butyrivibrio sp. ob235]|uniref:sodium-dependent transporter n=1 Tax=Butyrivibrio sp. ob235 TaxID=1761780 RepID=UPI0008D4A4C9|nr:sodium-dependent transporter [Butyrivibrio sp. ob235]SEL50209.1 neurotransmitter:Na+ symporter, NSS family [Butyrivibrio sp. ob235]
MYEEQRGSFGSRLGFILVSAGCAIGIGNVWKFPYVTGANGGAVFVLFYLLFLILMGIPVMTMEFAIGRASGQTVVRGYQKLEKPGQKWHIHGWMCIIGCYLLMMYYTTVSGWMVDYFYKFASGQFANVATEGVEEVFGNMLANPKEMGIFMVITVVFGFLVLSLGVENGLERVNKVMMIGLLALIIVLALHSLTLEGAAKGVSFYLLPSWKRATEVGIGKVISAAMNQAFFTLSLGIGALEIFGSYMSKEHSLTGEAVRICALDTFVAIISGLIIFPACFSYNVEPGQGPALIFITLPKVFLNMNLGRLWGTLFFIFMTFASFSTVTAVFENLVAFLTDNLGWSRGKSIFVNCIFILVASIPCVLGYNVWSDLHIIGARDVLDSEDFIVSNILLPLGSLIFLLFCTTKFGWGFDKYIEETNTGVGMKMPHILKYYFKFILPILIAIILIQGLLP